MTGLLEALRPIVPLVLGVLLELFLEKVNEPHTAIEADRRGAAGGDLGGGTGLLYPGGNCRRTHKDKARELRSLGPKDFSESCPTFLRAAVPWMYAFLLENNELSIPAGHPENVAHTSAPAPVGHDAKVSIFAKRKNKNA